MPKTTNSGNFFARANHNKLHIVIDTLSGVVDPFPADTIGSATMRGGPLAHIPKAGKFRITFTSFTCTLEVFDNTDEGMLVTIWEGMGTQKGLAGTWDGEWKRIDVDEVAR
ncbi:hypothetical protein EUX98_g3732 [Antrodiella citrinella]|uniref:Uncharacterized protein n=1 Tax=Antrodiella citrinella TaxID=2447956 RepID=A0A4S4MVS7_9APHY|nr:hypothetical protein EUX98_g3732 [Antrodiella citrinella]